MKETIAKNSLSKVLHDYSQDERNISKRKTVRANSHKEINFAPHIFVLLWFKRLLEFHCRHRFTKLFKYILPTILLITFSVSITHLTPDFSKVAWTFYIANVLIICTASRFFRSARTSYRAFDSRPVRPPTTIFPEFIDEL